MESRGVIIPWPEQIKSISNVINSYKRKMQHLLGEIDDHEDVDTSDSSKDCYEGS